jgi:hypothetical protein
MSSIAFFFDCFFMPANSDSASIDSKPRSWSRILLFAGSAAFGGLAVALWNRRELTRMQNERINPSPSDSQPAVDMEEEFF